MSPILKRLFHEHVRPYNRKLLIAMFFMALSALATAGMAKSLQPVIDEIFIHHNSQSLIPMAMLVMSIFILKGIAGFGEMTVLNGVGQNVVTDVQARLFRHLLFADYQVYHQMASGEMIARITHDVGLLRTTVSQAVTNIGKDILTLASLIGVMFYQDIRLAWITFIVFPLSVFPIMWVGRRVRDYARRTQEGMGAWTVFLEEILQGIRLIRSYTMEDYAVSRSQKLMEHLVRMNLRGVRARALAHPMLEILGGVAVVAVILFEGHQVIHGNQTAGTFVSFVASVLLAYEPLKRLAQLNAHLQEGAAAAQRIFALVDRPNTLQDGTQALNVTQGTVTMKNISFAYPSRPSVAALANITLQAHRGEIVGIVGPSGAGKSTLVNLLLRFFDPDEGSITIDDQPIPSLKVQSLRHAIAWVSQESILFDDTIAANIAQGQPNASSDDIIAAATQASAHAFIMEMPDGYETVIGQHGTQLSGGQRQRLAIARAILKNAPILILDEATSALDANTEVAVRSALDTLCKGRTTFVITHRLDTLRKANRIYVFDHGSIVQSGTYDALEQASGLFQSLIRDHSFQNTDRSIVRS